MPSDDKPISYRYQESLSAFLDETRDPALHKRLSEVLALLDFNSTLNRSQELSETLDLVLFVAMGETRASWAGILLRHLERGTLLPARRRGRSDERWSSVELPAPPPDWVTAAVNDAAATISEWGQSALTETGAAIAVPLTSAHRVVGVLLLGDRGERYGDNDRMFLEALAVSGAAAIDGRRTHEELQHLSRRLSSKVYQLNSVFDITRELNRSPDVNRVREVLLTNAMGHVLTTRAVMVHDGRVVEARGVTLSPKQRQTIEGGSKELRELEHDVPCRELGEGPLRELVLELQLDTVIPLRSGESCHGALLLGPRASGHTLAEEDRDFLRSLASQAAAAFDNLRLTREWVDKQKIEKEMALARDIQRGLLPDSDPGIAGWDIAGINIPCLTVGGDYFDYVHRGGTHHWLVIADVSGKGTGAALLMASVQAALHALAGLGDIALEALASRLNELVYRSTQLNRYVTAFFATVDTATGALGFVNAGHCYPILVRANGDVERLIDGGRVIGMFPHIELAKGVTQLDPGDLLLLYTDGLSETSSPSGEEFEEERIIELIRECAGQSSREIMARLVSGVRLFAAEAGLADDLTLMVVQRRVE